MVADAATKPVPEAEYCEPQRGPSLPGLLRELLDDFTRLFRQEIRLVRAETMEKAAQAGRNTVSIVVGGLVAFAGALALLAAVCAGAYAGMLVAGVRYEIAVWLAPLIVGLVVAIIGYAMVQKGISTLREMTMAPEKTAGSLKETARWMQDKVS
jgi:hypothetical protein